ncbi:tRNA (guanine(9)-N(1))-methyltransferase [Microbotryomycetes sp. JL221]|nr:tRNA (guanine(9)-N(1))-methyltransferase [Microbotryomycetes sp. JL221]
MTTSLAAQRVEDSAPQPTPSTSATTLDSAASTSTESAIASVDEAATQADAPAMSKNARKRLLKQQKFEATKLERRQKERQRRKERNAFKRQLTEQGHITANDYATDQQQQEAAAKRARKNVPKQPFNARIVIDCAFDQLMTDREVKSMASQLGFCYAANRASPKPLDLMITSLSGRLKQRFDSLPDKAHESWRHVEWWHEGYEQLWRDENNQLRQQTDVSAASNSSDTSREVVTVGHKRGQPRSKCDKSSIVYLTGDSPNILASIEEGKTYVLGGIVDRNRYKKLCFDKAEAQGIQHAQLPIGQYLPDLPTRKVLTVNQVYEIIVNWVESNDWAQALRLVMPERKLTEGKSHKKNDNAEAAESADEAVEGTQDNDVPPEEPFVLDKSTDVAADEQSSVQQ